MFCPACLLQLLVGVPFTPVTGQRLLVKPGEQAGAVRRALADSLQQVWNHDH
jgi:predicted N-acyltransferase